MKPHTVTLKEIAAATGVCVAVVRYREKKWGIDKARSRAREKPVEYFRDEVNAILIAGKIIDRPM